MEKHWIQGAIKKPGALRDYLENSNKIKKGKKIPMDLLMDIASKSKGKLKKRAQLAITLRHVNKGGK